MRLVHGDHRPSSTLSRSFSDIARTFWSGSERALFPCGLKNDITSHAAQFRGWAQQDAHELLTFLLDGLDEELRGVFRGELASMLACPRCGRDGRTSYEAFVSLSLPIAGARSLEDCMAAFMAEDNADGWSCPGCQRTVRLRRKTELWRVGDVLVLHLKRFSRHAKIRDPIAFPDTLDLNRYCAGHQPGMYRLYAVSEHFGGMNSGHYKGRARVVGRQDGEETWCLFEDASVTPAPQSEAHSEAAYILFYEKYDK
jgi:ubiquitin C-terminal hydrolase